MGLSPQHLFESSTADRLLLAWHLHLDRATVVSGRWRPFSISSSVARNHCRFPSRPSFVANDKDRFAHSNLGVGAFCAQPSFANGLWISRKHRSGHGYVSHARRLHVYTRPSAFVRDFLCPELSDQNYSASPIADSLLLLVEPAGCAAIHNSIHAPDCRDVDSAADKISNAVPEERNWVQQLLGRLGNHVLAPPDPLGAVLWDRNRSLASSGGCDHPRV